MSPLERIPTDAYSAYLREVLESGEAYEVCYHKPPHPHIWCGAIFWTEQELVDAYNSVSSSWVTWVTDARYITFCPYCLTYFRRERPLWLTKYE